MFNKFKLVYPKPNLKLTELQLVCMLIIIKFYVQTYIFFHIHFISHLIYLENIPKLILYKDRFHKINKFIVIRIFSIKNPELMEFQHLLNTRMK